jgi:hypothetical protein
MGRDEGGREREEGGREREVVRKVRLLSLL